MKGVEDFMKVSKDDSVIVVEFFGNAIKSKIMCSGGITTKVGLDRWELGIPIS